MLVVVGAAVWILGPGGPLLVAQIADGRSVWRLGKLKLEGVSGTALGDLVAARATLSDERGVWAEARDLKLGWSPLRIFGGDVVIEEAAAKSLHIFRRPLLTAPRPRGRTIDLDLAALRVERLAFDGDVFGEPAVFRLDGALAARGADVRRAGLIVARLDAPGDLMTLDLTRGDTMRFGATLASPTGGFFAKALGAGAPVAVFAKASGDGASGAGELDAKVGDDALASGAFNWTGAQWSGGVNVDLSRAPAFAELAQALGPRVRIDGRGARDDQRAFVATLNAAHAGVEARGRLGADWRPEGAAGLIAHTERLEAFAPAISRGAARFEGTLTAEGDASAFDGILSGENVGFDSVSATFVGPVRVRLTRTLADIDADVGVQRVEGPEAVTRLARNGRFTLDGAYDRVARRLSVRSMRLLSPNAELTGAGGIGKGAGGLRGRWRIAQLSEADRRIGGVADGGWMFSDARVLDVEGDARSFTTTMTPLDQMLGARPRLQTRMAIGDNGIVDVRRFDVDGAQLRLGAVGRIRDGIAALTFEASARGPLRVGAADIAGVADANGKLTGRLEDPAIDATGRMSRIDVAGLAIDKPTVTLRFAPTRGGAREGRVEIVGAVAGEPARAQAALHADDRGLALQDLTASVAGFNAEGDALLSNAGPQADISFSGAVDKIAAPLQGRIAGTAKLTPATRGEAVLALDAQLADGRFGNLVFSRLDAVAQGPLDRLTLRGNVHGAASGQPVSLNAEGSLSRANGVTTLRMQATGAVADAQVATRGPVEIRLAGGSIGARGAVTLDDGAATFDYSNTRGRVSLAARLENAPIAPIFAVLGERATGRANGTLTAAGDTDFLDGAIDMTIADALFARRARDPVTMQISGRLDGGVMTLRAEATSRNGLDAAIDGRAPVNARAHPMRIALAGEGRATWRAKGPADALWGIVGSLDQQVAGNVNGAGDLRFAAGRLSGNGTLDLAGGRFADKQSGIDLRDVNARIAFRDDAAQLESFSARDANGGTLTGTGRADGLKSGQIDLVARNVRLLGRPDARAVASGPLALRWTDAGATLTGDLTLAQATLAPPRAASNIPMLDVVEINRPAILASEPRRRQSVLAATLDVRVRAPGRVFLRGRGLDSEWAVDLRVRGPADNPGVYGTAELVRGRFTLAGRPFDAERGLIRFNGAPEEALIDLVAELSAPELTARVALTGSVSDPDIELSSTPPLPEDEILPQALFGRASEDLSALEAAQLAASLAELAGQASLNIAGAARELVGLDRLDVRDTGVGLRIAGGKYLTRNVYLEVARTGVGETETQVEWRVRPQLFLISAFQPNGDRRLSVRWRREY